MVRAVYLRPVTRFEDRLAAVADPRTRDWWERYLKGSVPFRGVPMREIRRIVHEEWDRDATRGRQLDLALAQFAERYCEDKLVGVLALAEIVHPGAADVPRLAEPFAHIDDWGTCDWYCVKVLGPLIDREPAAAPAIAGWRHAPGLWQRRAAAVAFVNLVARGDHADLVLEVCRANVRDPARFMQTSVGWVLRELSKARPDAVRSFLGEHGDRMSAEARRAACRHLG